VTALSQRPDSLLEISLRASDGVQGFDPAVREFLDEFNGHPERRAAAIAEKPVLLDDVKDAYLAAVAEHLATSHGLDVPAWCERHGRRLQRAFFAGGLESLKATLTVESPAAFRRRLLFVSKNALDRPRMDAQR
jgi:hypothetical protein